MEDLKYFSLLFVTENKTEWETVRHTEADSLMWYWAVVVKRQLNQKLKLSMYQLIHVPALTYGHELRV